MLLSEQAYRKIDEEVTKFPQGKARSAVLASLTIAQDEKGWVSPEIVEDVANYLGVPPIAVQEVASFYNMLDTKPVGRYKLAVCTNLPCALCGAEKALAHIREKLGVDLGGTTPDGLFTVVEAECMGACGDAPLVLVNNKQMCVRMSDDKLDAMIDLIRREGKA
ncbi:MAG: NADH-quinone oxidoreductase subunit NuoE [Candidimonas sp.]|nr:MAG: NADH-quinone oxidoreductase subunit NuoE [Candidimonas sp.]